MEKLCKPLDERFGIDYITYARYHLDGSYSILFTDGRSVENCFRHNDYRLPGQTLKPGVYTWIGLYSEAVLADLREAYGHDHGVTLIVQEEGFLDHITFSTKPENHNILDLYMNHPNLLYQLRAYFLETGGRIIEAADKNTIALPNYEKPTDELTLSSEDEVELMLPLKRYPVFTDHGKTYLTPREISCLALYMKMHTSKEIARVLDISHRTVEFHLNNIKEKLGVMSKSELYAICEKNHLV